MLTKLIISQRQKGWLIGVILILGLIIRLFPYRQIYSQDFEVDKIKELYSQSQYATKPEDRQEIIEDWDLYALAGVEYVTKGDLSEINVEHPPLGKYLFGLSILIWGNPVIIQLVLALIWLYLVYLIAEKFLKSPWLACLIPLGVMSEFLFTDNVTHSLLDLFQATTISWFIYLTLTKPRKKQSLWLGLALGMVASIKYPVAAGILLTAYGLHLWLKLGIRQALKKTAVVALVAGIVFLITYWPLLARSGLTGFMEVQLRAARIHLSHVPEYPKLAPVRVMLLNQWPVWFDKLNPIWQAKEWNMLWPVLGLGLMLSPLALKFKKVKLKKISVMFWFSWLYFIFINSRLFFPSYLFLILPYLYLILVWELAWLWQKLRGK